MSFLLLSRAAALYSPSVSHALFELMTLLTVLTFKIFYMHKYMQYLRHWRKEEWHTQKKLLITGHSKFMLLWAWWEHKIALAQSLSCPLNWFEFVITLYTIRHQQSIPEEGYASAANIPLTATNWQFYYNLYCKESRTPVHLAGAPVLFQTLMQHEANLSRKPQRHHTGERD